jgi:hypothetical protein
LIIESINGCTLNLVKEIGDNHFDMQLPIVTLSTLLVLAISATQAESPPVATKAPTTKATTSKAGDAKSADTLDLKKVQAEYADGNFETVVQILEDYRSKHKDFRIRDSVLIAKYLGVIFTSNPDSREKGKYWLYKMLQLDGSEDLVDLYVGDEVDRTFDKVRQEFIVRRNYRGINDTKLTKAVQSNEEPGKRDTVVHRDTVIIKGDNWATPLTDVVKGGLSEVKGGIKAGIQGGYVAVKEEPVSEKSWGWTGNINFGAGLKFLSSEWADLHLTDATEFRLATDIRQRGWPINVALDLIYDQTPDVNVSVTNPSTGVEATDATSLTTIELNAGVRKIVDFRLYSVRPFYGGGFGRMTTTQNLTAIDSRRNGKISIWFNGGCYWELGRHFNIGLEYLYSWAKIDLGDGPVNHGGSHFDMIAGFHF